MHQIESKSATHRISYTWSTGATGAMIALTVVIVAMAGPINRYTEDTAAQILDTSAYIDILQTPMIGEDD